MRKFLKKFSLIEISELIVVLIIIVMGDVLVNFSFAAETELRLRILPSPESEITKPQITTIIVYPNLKALSIGGDMGQSNKTMWLEDLEQDEISQLLTDENSDFIAALDHSCLTARKGLHRVVVYIATAEDESVLLSSDIVTFTIDDDFNVILDPSSANDVTLSSHNITRNELEDLQSKYQLKIIGAGDIQPLINRLKSYTELVDRYVIWRWVIIIYSGLAIIFLIVRRWLRKRSQHKSFWSLGNGIYLPHNNS